MNFEVKMADNGTNEALTKETNETLLQRSLIILFFCFSAKMPTFKKNKNLKGKFTSSQIDRAVKDVLNRRMGIREAGRMHNIHKYHFASIRA